MGPGLTLAAGRIAPSLIAGELRGYGLGAGGSLAIAAGTVQIGGAPSLTESELYLDPSFFQSGGFSNFRIIGWNGVTVAPGTVIEPKVKSFLVDPAAVLPASGARVRDFAAIGFKPDQLRAPTSLALYAPNYGTSAAAATYHVGDKGVAGDIILGAGSVIRTDPGATVDIRAARELAIYGTILAPGGTINLANDQVSGIAVDVVGPDIATGAIQHRANVTLWVDASARLLAPGLVQTFVDPATGQMTSRTFDGGSVALTGDNIVVQPGSVIDVSGAVGPFILSTAPQSARFPAATQQIATAAGSITVTPGSYLYFDPTLRVQPGDPSMQGATFALNPVTSVATTLPLAFNLPSPDYPGSSAPGTPDDAGSKILMRDGSGRASDVANIGDAIPALVPTVPSTPTRLEFSVFEDSLQRAGFDNLIFATRDGVIAFKSSVTLSAGRSIQLLSRFIGGDGGVNVTVNAPYVAFGGAIRIVTGGGDPAAPGKQLIYGQC